MSRMNALELATPGPDGPTTIAIATMDGRWWVDWPQVEREAKLVHAEPVTTGVIPAETGPVAVSVSAFAQLLWAARNHIPEVSREKAEELALKNWRVWREDDKA